MSFVKVNGSEYVRDTHSMGLSNTNTNEKNEYYAKLRMIQNQKEGINKVNEEINVLKNDITEIKTLLSQLLNRV
jgi:archaellum component FlaC